MKNEKETEDGDIAAAEPKKKRKSKILFAVLAIVMLGMIGYIVYLQIIGPQMSEEAKIERPPPQPEMYPFERLTTNPAESAGRRLVLVSLVVEYDSKKDKYILQEIENKKSQLQHILINILSSKTVEKLETEKDELRKEILDTLNKSLITGQLKEVYFTEFVIQ